MLSVRPRTLNTFVTPITAIAADSIQTAAPIVVLLQQPATLVTQPVPPMLNVKQLPAITLVTTLAPTVTDVVWKPIQLPPIVKIKLSRHQLLESTVTTLVLQMPTVRTPITSVSAASVDWITIQTAPPAQLLS